jgi:hypothetical protein
MPVRGNKLYCSDCDHPQPDVNYANCENCGQDLGAPNVNMVSTDDEENALQKRYDDAKKFVVDNGNEDILNNFEIYFNTNVKAIINMTLETLVAWVINSEPYKSYYRAVDEGLRPIANLLNDQRRTVIDSYLYGIYGRDITYAALTLNDSGLESYGECRVTLKEDSIKARSSILEENAFHFVKNHNINFEKLNIPAGYRSTWQNKLKLALAKIYLMLKSGSSEKDFPGLILINKGVRNADEFIEVHIYKELTNLAIGSIFIPVPKNKKDKYFVKLIEEKLPGKVIQS